jgi:hypothetical protein
MVNFSIQVCLGSPLTYGLNTYNHFIEIISRLWNMLFQKFMTFLKTNPSFGGTPTNVTSQNFETHTTSKQHRNHLRKTKSFQILY